MKRTFYFFDSLYPQLLLYFRGWPVQFLYAVMYSFEFFLCTKLLCEFCRWHLWNVECWIASMILSKPLPNMNRPTPFLNTRALMLNQVKSRNQLSLTIVCSKHVVSYLSFSQMSLYCFIVVWCYCNFLSTVFPFSKGASSLSSHNFCVQT